MLIEFFFHNKYLYRNWQENWTEVSVVKVTLNEKVDLTKYNSIVAFNK